MTAQTPPPAPVAASVTSAGQAGQLSRLLRPRSVAFVGASSSPVKVGGRRWLSMVGAGFAGSLYPVHPTAASVAGVAAVPSVAALPEAVDLVVIAIRPDAVMPVVEECAARGVGGVIVITGGFGEQSDDGKALEQALKAKLNAAGARMIGPNCAGIFCSASGVNVTGMVIPSGPIGLITQSGNVLLDTAHKARASGCGFSYAVSTGNGVDIRPPELLSFLLDDPDTKAIVVYLEGWQEGEGRRFCEIARAARGRKPVIMVKPGETEAGRRATMSHTGSLAGETRVSDGAFGQAGIIKADSIDAAWALAEALSRAPPLRLPRIAVASDGGGHATLGCDAAELSGLSVVAFSDELKADLQALLPERCPVANPVDYAGFAEEKPAVVAESLNLCLRRPEVGAALLAGHFGGYHRLAGESIAAEEMAAATRLGDIMRQHGKPIVVHSVYANDAEPAVAAMRAGGVPVVRTLPAAAALLAGMHRFAGFAARAGAARDRDAARAPARAMPDIFDILQRGQPGGALLEPDARGLLARWGLPVTTGSVVRSAEACAAAVTALGRPAALKIVSARIIHKSDVGGVMLNVTAAGAVAAFQRLIGIGQAAGDPDAAVFVDEMAGKGVELVLGAFRDLHFGPVVMAGLGGTLVEVLHDVTFRMAPLQPGDATDMIDEIRTQPMLRGHRGLPVVDRAGLAGHLETLALLMATEPRIREIDINPIIATEAGFRIVDARVILAD